MICDSQTFDMGIGGRRHGAGRPGWRRKCEDCLPLDIRQIKARRRLYAGANCSWQWTVEGEPIGAIGLTVDHGGLRLRYRVDGASMAQRIEFTWTPCPFGGRRTWLLCPNCRRRCAIVYGVDSRGRFSCRSCLLLAYSSEAEDTVTRSWRKQLKIELNLDPDGNRPKWMRRTTYLRLCDGIDCAENTRREALVTRSR